MNINELPGRLKVRHTDDVLTGNASLLGHHGLATRLGLIDDLQNAFPGYQSNRAYPNLRYPYLQILSHAAGGVGIEQTRKISSDLPLGRMLFPDQANLFDENPSRTESYFPAPNTLGDWYRNRQPEQVRQARGINRNLCTRIINQINISSLHIDIDSKMHVSSNQKAKRNRDGTKGYNPLYATIPTLKLVLDPLFRPGDAHPASDNASMTGRVLEWLRGTDLDRVRITLDNAGCQVDVMNAIEQAHRRSDKSIHVYTRPSSPDQKLPRKMFKSIEGAGGDWKPIEIYYENNRKKYRYMTDNDRKERDEEKPPPPAILDADYTLTSQNGDWAGRLILIREPVPEPSAQNSFTNGWRYYPVLTNDWSTDPIDIPHEYNQRGAGEDTISEIVQQGEAERFPCREDHENGLYLALCAMGHNLDQAMKKVTDNAFQHRASNPENSSQTEGEKNESQTSEQVKKPAHQEILQLQAENSEQETIWFQFTIQKFRQLLLSIPARITSESSYRYLNFPSHNPFGELLEQVLCACWRKTPLCPSRPPP